MIYAILGSLGGIIAVIGACVVVVRAIFKQVAATEQNTDALRDLRDTVAKLDTTVDDHSVRIARLEERLTMRRPPR